MTKIVTPSRNCLGLSHFIASKVMIFSTVFLPLHLDFSCKVHKRHVDLRLRVDARDEPGIDRAHREPVVKFAVLIALL